MSSPRGLALALHYEGDDLDHTAPTGWCLIGAPEGEAFDFAPGVVDELYRAAADTLAAAQALRSVSA